MLNRVASGFSWFFSPHVGSKPLTATFRAVTPFVAGCIKRLCDGNTGWRFFTYANADRCAAGYSIQPFRGINAYENNYVNVMGSFSSLSSGATTVIVGAVLSGFIEAARMGKISCSPIIFFRNAPKQVLKELRDFARALSLKEYSFLISMIGMSFAAEMAARSVDEAYDHDSSGHFRNIMLTEFINSWVISVILRMKQNNQNSAYCNSTNGRTWISSWLNDIMLVHTMSECHKPSEGATGIALGVIIYSLSVLCGNIAQAIRDYRHSAQEEEEQRTPLFIDRQDSLLAP